MNGPKQPLSTVKKLWIGIAVLAVLSPLGLALPRLFGAQGAWGEWTLDQVKRMLGFLPEGMEKSGDVWRAPMTDYAIPGQHQGMVHEGLGYALSALIGIAAVVLITWALAGMLRRRDRQEKRKDS